MEEGFGESTLKIIIIVMGNAIKFIVCFLKIKMSFRKTVISDNIVVP